MTKHRKPRKTTAINSRKAVYKYLPIKNDKDHSIAVPGGRCHNCNKITVCYCDKCNLWICEKHLVVGQEEGECYCKKCSN
ncbi:MAG: hypothetical protein ABIC04_05910 [Nanoarchaeota archaeon]